MHVTHTNASTLEAAINKAADGLDAAADHITGPHTDSKITIRQAAGVVDTLRRFVLDRDVIADDLIARVDYATRAVHDAASVEGIRDEDQAIRLARACGAAGDVLNRVRRLVDIDLVASTYDARKAITPDHRGVLRTMTHVRQSVSAGMIMGATPSVMGDLAAAGYIRKSRDATDDAPAAYAVTDDGYDAALARYVVHAPGPDRAPAYVTDPNGETIAKMEAVPGDPGAAVLRARYMADALNRAHGMMVGGFGGTAPIR
jgi:hypothetical protein